MLLIVSRQDPNYGPRYSIIFGDLSETLQIFIQNIYIGEVTIVVCQPRSIPHVDIAKHSLQESHIGLGAPFDEKRFPLRPLPEPLAFGLLDSPFAFG